MRHSHKGLYAAVAAFTVLASLATPFTTVSAASRKKVYTTVSAIKGADEKAFADPVSRCVTAHMKALYAKAVETMKTDIEKHGTEHEDENSMYQERLDIVWSAMEQPYCGYGAYGMTAVTKSFNKSIAHVRSDYLLAVK